MGRAYSHELKGEYSEALAGLNQILNWIGYVTPVHSICHKNNLPINQDEDPKHQLSKPRLHSQLRLVHEYFSIRNIDSILYRSPISHKQKPFSKPSNTLLYKKRCLLSIAMKSPLQLPRKIEFSADKIEK